MRFPVKPPGTKMNKTQYCTCSVGLLVPLNQFKRGYIDHRVVSPYWTEILRCVMFDLIVIIDVLIIIIDVLSCDVLSYDVSVYLCSCNIW